MTQYATITSWREKNTSSDRTDVNLHDFVGWGGELVIP